MNQLSESLFNIVKKFTCCAFLIFSTCTLFAFNQPPLNHSITTFLDGGAPLGFYYMNYSIFSQGRNAVDKDGKTIPGDARVNALALSHQFYYFSPVKFLGGNLSLDVILNVSAVTAKGAIATPFGPAPMGANTAGLSDIIVGPSIIWNDGKLFGGPVFQRFELQTTLPTGKYDKGSPINPGSNLTTFDPYYSVVWMFAPKWETSWRFYYAVHSENDEVTLLGPVGPFQAKVKPGQLFHLNYAFSREILPFLRLGVAGYYLQQLTEDRIDGIKQTDTKEKAFAAGPGLVLFNRGGTMFALSHPVEFGVRNRFKGSRTTLQIINKF